jgi:hypothetical protein
MTSMQFNEIYKIFDLNELIKVSKLLGTDLWHIQGPGGNISNKNLQYDKLIVKGSGLRLKDVNSYVDFPIVDTQIFKNLYPKSKTFIPNPEEENRYISAIVHSSHNSNVLRPSMETGFHCIIPSRWVLHLHSLIGIFLGALHTYSPSQVDVFFDDYFRYYSEFDEDFIDQAIPGLHLTNLISDKINLHQKNYSGRYELGVFFLKSHGVVWYGNCLNEITNTIKNFETFAMKYFQFDTFDYVIDISNNVVSLNWISSPLLEPLFPDFCVFFPSGIDKVKIDYVFNHTLLSFDAYREHSKVRMLDLMENFISHCILSHIYQVYRLDEVYFSTFARIVQQMEIEKLRLKQSRE